MLLAGGILIGFIHLMAVVLVSGSAFFKDKILPKAIGHLPPPEQGRIKMISGKYFGMLAGAAIGTVLITGVIRVIALELFTADIMFGTAYGLVLTVKLVLFGFLIAGSAVLAKSGAIMEAAAASDGGSALALIEATERKMQRYEGFNDITAKLIILLSVAMRFIGPPTL
jgi:uncharacterized membrane protein